MKQRVSDERLAEDLDNDVHENEWDRKTAEDLRDARAELAKYKAVEKAARLLCFHSSRFMQTTEEMVYHRYTDDLREALEAVKND